MGKSKKTAVKRATPPSDFADIVGAFGAEAEANRELQTRAVSSLERIAVALECIAASSAAEKITRGAASA